ncbi:MAG: TonB-dependent receptor, partial [Gammaproteobacteria bacterium]
HVFRSEDPFDFGIGDAGDISGNELLRQSKWQGNFTLNYERSVFGDWSVYSRSDVLYTGAQWVGASNQAKVPEFVDVNQRLGLETDDLRIELWIENLLDDDTPRAAFRDVTFNNTHLQLPPRDAGFNDMFPFRLSVSHPRRRTFGVSAVLKF